MFSSDTINNNDLKSTGAVGLGDVSNEAKLTLDDL